MGKSIMQSENVCFVTGSDYDLHKHHIFQGPNRQASETYGCWVWLRSDWHNMAPYGVHGKDGAALDAQLKSSCQEKFEALYGHRRFMAIFGRNYKEDAYEPVSENP